MTQTYYFPNNCRLTVAELWRVSKNPLEFALAVILKLFGITVSSGFGFAMTDRLMLVAPGAVAKPASTAMKALADEATTLGFEHGFYFSLPTVGNILGYGLRLRSRDRVVLGQVNYIRAGQNNVFDERTMFSFSTKLNDGRWIITSGHKRQEDGPPEFVSEHYPRKSMREVLHRHYERLGGEVAAPVSIATDEVFESLTLEIENRTFEFNIARGLLEALSPERVAELKTQRLDPDSLQGENDASQPSQSVRKLEWVSWFALAFGVFLFMKGDAANQAQFLFRAVLVGVGLIGAVVALVLRMRRSTE